MKRFFLFLAVAVLVSQSACQKQPTEEERRAEVERQVQERLAAEHQQEQARQLAQRAADLKAREQALSEQEKSAQAIAAVPAQDTSEAPPISSEDGETADSYAVFYDQLEPYGDWIESADYGYVYRPREASSNRWRPYTNGHWVYTEVGWTWISDEPFGWATYHYGRWTRLHGVGWVWVPGDQWAPAWVSWRKGGDFIGWAPLPPEARVERGRGIQQWSDNYYGVGPDQYVFVTTAQFGDQRLERAIVPEQRNISIVNETTNITNITFNNQFIVNQGPNYEELRRRSQQPIARLRLERETGRQGGNLRPVVRGDVVEMPAPAIAPRRKARPRTVKENIAQTAVDLGWAGVGNPREAERARKKMQAEATPPLNAPPKTFVKEESSVPAATAAPVTAATAVPVVTAAPAATPLGIATPRRLPVASALPSASAEPSITPIFEKPRRLNVPPETDGTAAPRFLPPRRRLPSPAPTANQSANPSPASSMAETTPRWKRSAAKQFGRPNPTIPLGSPASSSSKSDATATPAAP